MLKNAMFRRGSLSFEAVCLAIVVCFVVGIVFVAKVKTPGQVGLVNNAHAAVYGLPIPTKLLPVTDNRSYPLLKGIKVNPKDPFHLEFIIDSQDKDEISKEEFNRLVEYFLAALTTPQDELWVNLSPHEQDRVIPQDLSYTELGKDLLGQDYILKQLTSSLTYPETELGKKYWKRLHEEVYQLAGTTNIPINTFNKVWIVPKSTRIYEKDNVALITEATLKAMHEEDYFALDKGTASKDQDKSSKINKLSAKVLKEIVLPEIEYNINHGEHFAKLRQMYHSLILAAWFKKTLKDSIYQHYIDQNKVEGIDLEDRGAKDKIFNLYVEAYKKGVYDYIKTDKEPQTSKKLRRRYCSGGIPAGEFGNVDVVTHDNENEAALVSEEMKKNGAEMGTVGLTGSNGENLEGDSTEINVTEVVGFDNVVEAMREEHKRTGKKIRAEFNGVILEFTGEESNEDMLNGFREKWSQKNKAHRDSPEGQAAKKEREEAARASNEKKQAWESKFGEYKESDPVRWIEAYLQ
ncbi:MAG: hypothetical protein GY858_04540, partial [Candidatus Omnitrophica bacterium]|nr:hypothetical protein [Candidatus Omnitrophota bacterium]